MPRPLPPLDIEIELSGAGFFSVAGIDEAGRGPLFGPLVVGAVIVDIQNPPEAYDSKTITRRRRDELAASVRHCAVAHSTGVVSAGEIDSHGMSWALAQGVQRAVAGLDCAPDFLLIDGPHDLSKGLLPSRRLVKGELRSRSIAAASLIAKTERDSLVDVLAAQYPGYGLEAHGGYGTPAHIEALRRLGPTPQHRHSFSPIKGR